MSFSVRDEAHAASSTTARRSNTLFAQRRNLLRPSFRRMLRDILRFNREAPALLGGRPAETSRSATTSTRNGYSREFVDALPRADGRGDLVDRRRAACCAFPARFFVRFFAQPRHAARSTRAPQWRAIRGGSARYVEGAGRAVPRPHPPATPVESVRRIADRVLVKARGDGSRALRPRRSSPATATRRWRLLADADAAGARGPRRDSATRRTRRCCTPTRAAAARAARLGGVELPRAARDRAQRVALTYNMNILQRLDARRDLLRHAEPQRRHRSGEDPASASSTTIPLFTPAGVAAQRAAARDQRRAAHLLLRRLLALRLPRGRRGERARRARALRSDRDPCTARSITGGLGTGASRRAAHAFRYRLFMVYLDLAELRHACSAGAGCGRRGGRRSRGSTAPTTSATRRCRSTARCAISSSSAADAGRRARSACSRTCATSATASTRSASTTASTTPASAVEAIVAEVNNTPWGERHCYVLDRRARTSGRRRRALAVRQGVPRLAVHADGPATTTGGFGVPGETPRACTWRMAHARAAATGSSTRRCALERRADHRRARWRACCCAFRS